MLATISTNSTSLLPKCLYTVCFETPEHRRDRVHVGAEIPALQEHVGGCAEDGRALAGGTSRLFNLVGWYW